MSELSRAYAEKPKRNIKDRVLRFLGRIGNGVEAASYETMGLSPEAIQEIQADWNRQEHPQPLESVYSTENLVRAAASTEIKIR